MKDQVEKKLLETCTVLTEKIVAQNLPLLQELFPGKEKITMTELYNAFEDEKLSKRPNFFGHRIERIRKRKNTNYSRLLYEGENLDTAPTIRVKGPGYEYRFHLSNVIYILKKLAGKSPGTKYFSLTKREEITN